MSLVKKAVTKKMALATLQDIITLRSVPTCTAPCWRQNAIVLRLSNLHDHRKVGHAHKQLALGAADLTGPALLLQGTSTACILALDDSKLHAANVGDSGFIVVRKQKVVFKSPSQQHRFNFPYQLGCPGTMSDTPEDAEVRSYCNHDGLLRAFFSPETSLSIQKHPFYSGNLNSETPGDSQTRFYTVEMF